MSISDRLHIDVPDYEAELTKVAEVLREIIRLHHEHSSGAENKIVELAKVELKRILKL